MELLFAALALMASLILTAVAWRERADEATTQELLPNPRPGAGCQCPDCDAVFTRPDVRNLHYMRKHADRRRLRA